MIGVYFYTLLFQFMSQYIQKFQEGGSPQLFTYPAGQIETSRMVQAISVNLDKYLSDKNWSRSRKERFVNSVNKFISGIESGSINAMSPTGTFKDSRGAVEGVSDLNGTRRFREDKEAARFVKWVLDSQTPYKEPEKKEEPKKDPFNLGKRFVSDFNNKYFSSDSDYIDQQKILNGEYTPETLGNSVFTVLDNITTDNWGNIITGQEDYNQRVSRARGIFDNNKTFKGLKAALDTLNIDTSFIPEDVSDENSTGANATPDYTKILNKTWEGDDKNLYDLVLDDSRIFKPNIFELDILPSSLSDPDKSIKALLYNMAEKSHREMRNDSGVIWTERRGALRQKWTYSQVLNQLIPYISSDSKRSEYMTDLGDGKYLITPTFNPAKHQHVLIYDQRNNKVSKRPVRELYKKHQFIKEKVDKAVKEWYERRVRQQKQGGSIKKYQNPNSPLWGDEDLFKDDKNEYIKWDTSNRYKITSNDGQKFNLEKRSGKVTDEISKGNGLYDPEPYGDKIEGLSYYGKFQTALNTNPKLAESWAKGYQQHNPTDISQVSKSWFTGDTFDYGKFKTRTVGSDKVNGPGHDVYKGVRYYDKDNRAWVKPADIADNYDFTGDKDYIDPNNPLITVKYVKTKNTNADTSTSTDAATDGKKSSQVTAAFGKNNSLLNMANIRKILPYLGETQRWLATAASNKELYDKSLINPLYTSAPHFEINQYRDLAAEIQGQQAAATANALGSTPLTSDASLTANQQLDADKLANQYKQQGLTTSAKKAEETGLRAVLQSKENEIKAVDNANANAKARYTADAYNQQQELGYLQKKWNNNDTYSKAMQSLLQKDMDERTALVEQQLKQYLAANYDYTQNPEYISLQNELQAYVKSRGSSEGFDSKKLQRMAQIKRDMSTQHAYEMIKQLAALRGYSNINKYIPDDMKKATIIPQSKNGGVLLASGGRISDEARIKIAKIKDELERQKLFQKSIEHSIKVNDKKLDQLSNTMQKLLMNMVK